MSSAVPLTQAVTAGDVNAVKAALANGADVNERNNGGQTALILAVIFGHADLVQLLVQAGADPHLRDNLGLDAIEWAQRRGLTDAVEVLTHPPIAPPEDTKTRIADDEKSRRWLAGLKQRIAEEQSVQSVQSVSEPPPPPPERKPVSEPPTPSVRKRCPKCGATYSSELVAYCAHHIVPLVDVDPNVDSNVSLEAAPILSSPATNNTTSLLWIFVLITAGLATFTGYLITSQLSRVIIPDPSPGAAAPSQSQIILRGSPVASDELAGKAVHLPEAECPANGPETFAGTVTVQVMVDKSGKVYWARADGGDEALRAAASEAATKSTFAPERLRGRETEGTITYTFAP